MKDLRKIQEFFSKPAEDKIDTSTMDVPLFLRTIEYAQAKHKAEYYGLDKLDYLHEPKMLSYKKVF